jgi:hypothetical protein
MFLALVNILIIMLLAFIAYLNLHIDLIPR